MASAPPSLTGLLNPPVRSAAAGPTRLPTRACPPIRAVIPYTMSDPSVWLGLRVRWGAWNVSLYIYMLLLYKRRLFHRKNQLQCGQAEIGSITKDISNMRFSILSVIAAATTGLLSLLPFASANVESFGVPQVVRIGEPFEAILTKADTLSSILDVAVAWGVQDAANAHGSNEIVGYPIGSTYLGPGMMRYEYDVFFFFLLDISMDDGSEEIADDWQTCPSPWPTSRPMLRSRAVSSTTAGRSFSGPGCTSFSVFRARPPSTYQM